MIFPGLTSLVSMKCCFFQARLLWYLCSDVPADPEDLTSGPCCILYPHRGFWTVLLHYHGWRGIYLLYKYIVCYLKINFKEFKIILKVIKK